MKAWMGMMAATAMLAACAAPVQWEKPGVSGAEVSRDAANCRSFASSEANRRYLRDNPAEDRAAEGPTNSFQNTMARNDAALFQNKVYNDCMASHGYKKGDGTKP